MINGTELSWLGYLQAHFAAGVRGEVSFAPTAAGRGADREWRHRGREGMARRRA